MTPSRARFVAPPSALGRRPCRSTQVKPRSRARLGVGRPPRDRVGNPPGVVRGGVLGFRLCVTRLVAWQDRSCRVGCPGTYAEEQRYDRVYRARGESTPSLYVVVVGVAMAKKYSPLASPTMGEPFADHSVEQDDQDDERVL